MVARMRIAAACIGAAAIVLGSGCQEPNGTGPKRSTQQEKSSSPKGGNSADPVLVETPEIESSTYLAAARLHESQGRLREAVQQYEFAVQEDPTNVQLLARVGAIYDRLGNGAMAEKTYLEALRQAPSDARLHNNLAFSYILRSKWKDAEIELTRAIELAPDFARARVNLGMVLGHNGQFDDAFKQFEAALPPADAWYNLGLMYQSKRKSVEAAWAYKRALELNPKLVAAKEQLSRMPSSTLGAADQMIERERQAEATAKAEADTVADARTDIAEDGLVQSETWVEGGSMVEDESMPVASTQPESDLDEADGLSDADEADETDATQDANDRWWQSLADQMPAFAPEAFGDYPLARIQLNESYTDPNPCNVAQASDASTRTQALLGLDELFPDWQRSPELIRGYSENSNWLTDGQYSRYDWQYSPVEVLEIPASPTVRPLVPTASTQPD
jgi:Flp pilus assembly protein TadD